MSEWKRIDDSVTVIVTVDKRTRICGKCFCELFVSSLSKLSLFLREIDIIHTIMIGDNSVKIAGRMASPGKKLVNQNSNQKFKMVKLTDW